MEQQTKQKTNTYLTSRQPKDTEVNDIQKTLYEINTKPFAQWAGAPRLAIST